jgi:hypothetical protein
MTMRLSEDGRIGTGATTTVGVVIVKAEMAHTMRVKEAIAVEE